MTNLFVGALWTQASYAFAGYVDDVRLHSTALSATEVYALYAGYPTNNNVYYSTDSGATFTGLSLGTSPMTACSISYDGSYLTATNQAGTVYTLNRNSSTFALAVGNQAGQINQASNAIAMGNQAGQRNQAANSIVLNASGSAVTATNAGFYVSPIAQTSGLTMDLLGYGADSQVVRTGINVLPGGYIISSDRSNIIRLADVTIQRQRGASLAITSGQEFSNPILYFGAPWSTDPSVTHIGQVSGAYKTAIIANSTGWSRSDLHFCLNDSTGFDVGTGYWANHFSETATLTHSKMVIRTNGNVGIGTTNPNTLLQVGNYGGSMGGVQFTTTGASSIATNFYLVPGYIYLLSASTNEGGSGGPAGGTNSTWFCTAIVSYRIASSAGVVLATVSSNNMTFSIASDGRVTVTAPAGNGTFSSSISAIKLC